MEYIDEMVVLKAKVYENNQLTKYEVQCQKSKEIYYISVNRVKALASRGLVYGVRLNTKTNSLYGDKIDLRKLKREYRNIENDINLSKTSILSGKNLKEYAEKNTKGYKERYIVQDIYDFCNGEHTHRVCMLHGLRHTGKTVSMLHTIKKINEYEKTIYVSLNENISASEVFRMLDNAVDAEIKYVFLDKVSEVNNFLGCCASLSDVYAKLGMKIVISGADSLLMEMMSWNKLYDRCIKIHTTYISYKEYCYLFNDSIDILAYIKLGGVLERNTFYDITHTNDYINSAILDNITHSLMKANNRYEHQRLLELGESGLLRKAIKQSISSTNTELTSKIITRTYENNDLGSGKQLIKQQFHIGSDFDISDIEDMISYRLSILKEFDAEIDEQYVEDLKEFLELAGLFREYKRYVEKDECMVERNSYLFNQPGLRYNQGLALLNELLESPNFSNLKGAERSLIEAKLMEDLEDNILEHIILIDTLEKYSRIKNAMVTQLRYQNKEIDMIIKVGNNINIYEIKRNSNIVTKQYKWLIDRELCDKLENRFCGNIQNRYVLYFGENKYITDGNYEIKYRNISDFLMK